MAGWKAFVQLGRPLFLAGGFLLHGLGVVIALYNGATLNLAALVWGQLAITAIQLMTHYSNEYFDLAADQANLVPTQWSGGSRVLVDALLPPRIALGTAVILSLLALIPTAVLTFVLKTGPLTAPLLLLALFLAWQYSAPPLRLHSRQLGELTVAILVTGLTPLLGFYLQAGLLTRLPFLAVFPLCCLQFNMIMALNFLDAAGDAAAGKRTVVVTLGESGAKRLYTAVMLLAYAALPILVIAGLPPLPAVAVVPGLPLAIWQARRVDRNSWQRPAGRDSLGFWSVALLIGTVVLELAAFSWLWRQP